MATKFGTEDGETLDGTNASDQFFGNGGGDIINGFDGNDTFFKLVAGDDIVNGGDGTDTGDYQLISADITFDIGATSTVTNAETGTDTLFSVERFHGGSGDDIFRVDETFVHIRSFFDEELLLFNLFDGGAGNDVIEGNGVTRILHQQATAAITVDLAAGTVIGDASVGTDTISGVTSVDGTDFDDTLLGSDNFDSRFPNLFELYRPGQGNDFIDGRGGIDVVAYNDSVNNGQALVADLATGQVTDGFGNIDTLVNIEGLAAGSRDDTMFGDENDNVFRPAGGDDFVNGRGGFDLVVYFAELSALDIDLAAERSEDGNGNIDTLISIENADGAAFDDTIAGDDGANVLNGRDGDDTLIGRDGDDVLAGQNGDDALDGGDGVDTADYSAAAAGVVVNLATQTTSDDGEGGVDSLASIENAIGSSFNDTLIGDGSSNTLLGGDGVDRLDGRDGDDVMIGGAGDDIYTVRDAGDVVTEEAGGGARDRINAFTDYTNPENNEFLVGAFSSVGLNLTGNEGRDRITGANRINSPDAIDALGGNDFIAGLVGDDTLNGGDGRDRIFGNSGNDVINGGGLHDVMTGQFGFDVFVFDLASGVDTITDFTTGTDRIDISAYGIADFAALDAITEDVGGRAQINLNGNQDVLRLNGVVEADLDAGDFIFAG